MMLTARSGVLLLLVTTALPAIAADRATEQSQARCEAARQAKLEPLRLAEIEKCVKNRGKRSDCERKFAQYGDATRTQGGKAIPRMFDDLPECVAARNAAQEKD